jgi:hypothetical protein
MSFHNFLVINIYTKDCFHVSCAVISCEQEFLMAVFSIWNPIHLVHVSTYRYIPTCTDLYYDIVCTSTYYLRNVA